MFSLRRKQAVLRRRCTHYTVLWTKQQVTCAFFNALSFCPPCREVSRLFQQTSKQFLHVLLIILLFPLPYCFQDLPSCFFFRSISGTSFRCVALCTRSQGGDFCSVGGGVSIWFWRCSLSLLRIMRASLTRRSTVA